MSYDIYMIDPKTKERIEFNEPHLFRGGTYVPGGTTEAWINITYNYSEHYRATIDKKDGIRWIYGKTGEECVEVLKTAISKLGTTPCTDYWKSTGGNAGHALLALIAFCELRPDGIFSGD